MTSNSLSCFREVRAERRANDLTVGALLRDVTRSAASMVSNAFSAAIGWYVAYDKRQQRRRHHYRRAMNAVSTKRLAAKSRTPALPMVTSPNLADAPFIHFAGSQTGALPNAIVSGSRTVALELPPAHVCADARRSDASHSDGCFAAS